MRVTDIRYAGERERLELALRMIRHEARTCTIRTCTGLTDDRIRRLYAAYFKNGNEPVVRRRRGKSPSRTSFYVERAPVQMEAMTLALFFEVFGLIQIDPARRVDALIVRESIEFGHRFCDAYDAYREAHTPSHIRFERAWSLYAALTAGDELVLAGCRECMAPYVRHLLEVDDRRCPCCTVKGVCTSHRRTILPPEPDGRARLT